MLSLAETAPITLRCPGQLPDPLKPSILRPFKVEGVTVLAHDEAHARRVLAGR